MFFIFIFVIMSLIIKYYILASNSCYNKSNEKELLDIVFNKHMDHKNKLVHKFTSHNHFRSFPLIISSLIYLMSFEGKNK